ncbi:uncharacterized protein DUF4345 [Sinobacterium caligoides]|uniref:Uncharacterized protein DUF4345 n=1 Tax=Sinobacterium caligoides TaxID=933926 RepID=A0A3N2DDT6_9GAMM|nr:DUF4345 family protein [Sinobacterium caligoides]ROR97949.1 uncharacterized protein DUF4345 [Sinobacterium caligoides]
MLFSKILLIISGLIFAVYGLLCAISPQLPAQYIGYQPGIGGSTVEIIAMYGGLQLGLGILYFVCALKQRWVIPGLWLILATIGSLGISRLLGGIMHGLDDYNMGALLYELSTTGLCLSALVLERAKTGSATQPVLQAEQSR